MFWPLIVNCLMCFFFTDFSQGQALLASYQECCDFTAPAYFLPNNVDQKRFIKNEFAPEVEISALNGAVMLSEDNSFLFTKEAGVARPIASLTKLMTALVFLENNPGFDREYKINSKDYIAGGKIHFWSGDTVTVRDLFRASLVGSDNVATRALVRSTGLSEEDFVVQMNKQARRLGMFSSYFTEPTGLAVTNVASAQDLARLVRATLAYSEITETSSLSSYSFSTKEGKLRKVETTNNLLQSKTNNLSLITAKTGYTEEAGYCFAAALNKPESKETIITIILGSPSGAERFSDTENLANWVTDYFSWR